MAFEITPLPQSHGPRLIGSQHAAMLLVATLRALDESVGAADQRMRDFHVPQFVMDLA